VARTETTEELVERIFHEHQHDDMQSYGHMTIHGGAVAALKDVAADLLREGERRGRERAIAVIENTLASTLQDRLINEIRARGENSV
jgi:hypothetical protein